MPKKKERKFLIQESSDFTGSFYGTVKEIEDWYEQRKTELSKNKEKKPIKH